ncbi:hypothetical protein [Kitasatospora sp. NPDC057223]|uniref:hypothetical protein n=1 Tax=Kitasatospora sp. NPDC057223 TaxID=3346055 RepID=UPI003636AA77
MYDQAPSAPPPHPQPWGAPPQAPPAYGAVPPQAQGHPGYGYGGYPPVAPKKSRRTLWILLGVLGLVVVLVVGLIGYFVVDVASKAGTHKIVLPVEFKGVARDDTSATAQQLRDSMARSFGDGDGSWKPTGVGALYQSDTESTRMIVSGGYGKVLSPQHELDSYFKGIAEGDGARLSGRRSVDPGPLGGKLDCAVASNGAGEFGVCAWADSSSIVGLMQGDDEGTAPDLDKLAADTRELRALAEIPK